MVAFIVGGIVAALTAAALIWAIDQDDHGPIARHRRRRLAALEIAAERAARDARRAETFVAWAAKGSADDQTEAEKARTAAEQRAALLSSAVQKARQRLA